MDNQNKEQRQSRFKQGYKPDSIFNRWASDGAGFIVIHDGKGNSFKLSEKKSKEKETK